MTRPGQPLSNNAFAEPEHTPTYTLDRQIAEARRRMGEVQWQRLYREFDR